MECLRRPLLNKPAAGVNCKDIFVNFNHSLACNFATLTGTSNTSSATDKAGGDTTERQPTIEPEEIEMLSLSDQRKPEKKAKSLKSQKSGVYRHTPTFAAQSFTLTATPEIYKKNQTHKLSRPVLERAKSRRIRTSPAADSTDDERSSGEYDRSSVKTPTSEREPGSSSKKSPRPLSNRFLAPTPHYALFSSSILNQEVPGIPTKGPGLGPDYSYTRGRPDWSEMDEPEGHGKSVRRTNSILSHRSGKSRRPKSHFPELHGLAEGDAAVLAMSTPKDDESVYKGRGCVPWRLRVNAV
ncbi:hypothetical protein Dda_4403 [Drechslerella dactyloides]|uniref:Uncharacterized protein n=1 Tax=Drechslerella dactyloides TaxID=74499 RepID=A0AAD6IWU2_DREDA|nr:hypothetical protein Dda_4403 [Drechslerella dactyloides]